MADLYKTRLFQDAGLSVKPPVGPLQGLNLMAKLPVLGAFKAQDAAIGLGRRWVCTWGWRGNDDWLTPDTDPGVGSTHPHPDTERVVQRAEVRLTPGHFLLCTVLAAPSGATQTGAATEGAPGGTIKISVTWDNGTDTEADVYEIVLHTSQEQYRAQPSGDGGLFKQAKRFELNLRPKDLFADVATVRKWGRGVTAKVTVTHIGSPRVLHGSIWERPEMIVYEHDDTDWASHQFSTVGADNQDFIPNLQWPFDELEQEAVDADPRLGTIHLLDVREQQHKQLGQVLAHWTAYTEEYAGITDTEVVAHSVTSTSAVAVLDSAQTSYDRQKPGWPIGAASYLRKHADSDEDIVLRGRTGVVPVRCWVYGQVTATNTATVRFQAGEYSWVDVTVTATSDAWTSNYGWLECGISPEQLAVGTSRPLAIMQPFWWVDGGTFSPRYWLVEHWDPNG